VSSPIPSLSVGPPEVTTDTPAPIYANVAHTSFTPYDFRITFSLLTPPQERPSVPGASTDVLTMDPEAVAQIVVPAGSVAGLIDLLRAQLDRFVEELGEPQPTAPVRAAGRA
jgi:hypothetical protein